MARFFTYRWSKAGCLALLFILPACSQLTLKQGEINQALYTGNVQQAYDILNTDVKRWEKNF